MLLMALAVMLVATTLAGASGVKYLPDVTSKMSQSTYWATEEEVLMTYEEIEALNTSTIATKGACMYDLKNMSEDIDGVSLNEALIKSTEADIAYYLGWTYIESDVLATKEDYAPILENTQNPNAKKDGKVLYGIAVRRTEQRSFPSEKAIWDDPTDIDLDYQYLTAVRVNEPLIITSVSKDGNFYLTKGICCSGWVRAEDVAICKDKAEWLEAWDIAPEDALVVYGDRVYTDVSITGPETSELVLTMGTVLKQADVEDPNELIDNRAAYQCYVAWAPVRNEDGSYSKKLTLISEHQKVSDGYLPLTMANIGKVTFSALGNTYGWGGSLNSDDCSGYMRNVYKCFGLELARNTSWQETMPMAKVDMKYMCREERNALLDNMPFGTILYFNGHEMMYLGTENGKYYVISAVGSMMQPGNDKVRQRIRSTTINTLDVKRANGNTWMDELTLALVPYWSVDSELLPKHAWYHDGVAYCLKNKLMTGDENKYFGLGNEVKIKDAVDVLWKYDGSPASEKTEENTLSDAETWALGIGLVKEGEYTSDISLTRQQLAGMLYTYSNCKGLDTNADNVDVSAYADMADVEETLVPAVKYLLKNKIMVGKTTSAITPNDNVNRAEFAVIVERYSKLKQQ